MIAVIVLTAVLVIGVHTWFRPFSAGVAPDLLDTARHLSEGKGLTTDSLRPSMLPYYRSFEPPFPYLYYPGVPLATSVLFAVFGVHAWLLLVFPAACYVAAGLSTFILGRLLFGATVGLCAALFLLIQPSMIGNTLSYGFTDPVLVCALVVSVLAIFVSRNRRDLGTAFLVAGGVALGIAQYARSAGLMLYVPMAALLWLSFDTQKYRRLAIFFAACLAVQLPMFAWYVTHIGSLWLVPNWMPLFLTQSFPGFTATQAILPTSQVEIFQTYGGDILRKWLSQVWVHYKYFFSMTSPLLIVSALLAYLLPMSRDQRALASFCAMLYGSLVLQNSLFIWDNRYLLPVVPFVAVLGFAFLAHVVSAWHTVRVGRIMAVTVLAILISVETIDFVYQSVKNQPSWELQRQTDATLTAFAKANLHDGDVVMSMDPALLAWEMRLPGVGMTVDLPNAERMYREFVKFNVLLLWTPIPHVALYGTSADWNDVISGTKQLLGFRIQNSAPLPSGGTVVVLREMSSTTPDVDGAP